MGIRRIYAVIIMMLLYYNSFINVFLELYNFNNANIIQGYSRIMTDFILVALLLFTINSFFKKENRAILLTFILFIISSTITYLWNSNTSMVVHLNGAREILQLFSIWSVSYTIINSKESTRFLKQFRIFLMIFIVCQIPAAVYQALSYGVGDRVGGTLGNGNSGTLTMVIFFILFYFYHIKDAAKFPSKYLYFIFFLPTLINETKITIVLLILFFFLVMRFKISQLYKNILLILLVVGAIFGYSIAYTNTQKGQSSLTFEKVFNMDNMTNYFASTSIKTHQDIPRITKTIIGFEINRRPMNMWFGQGYGIFKGDNLVASSGFTKEYNWLLKGTRNYFFYLFMQGGLASVIVVHLFIFFVCFSTKGIRYPYSRFRTFLFLVLLIEDMYSDNYRIFVFAAVFMFMALISNRTILIDPNYKQKYSKKALSQGKN